MNNDQHESNTLLDVRGLTKEFPVGTFLNPKTVHAVERFIFYCQTWPSGSSGR